MTGPRSAVDELIDEIITEFYREYVNDTFIFTAVWFTASAICLKGLWDHLRGNPK